MIKRLAILPLLFAAFIFFSIPAQAQAVDYRISITGRQIPLKEVFYSIRQQTGLQIFFSNELIDAEQLVTVNFKKDKLDKVLNALVGKGFHRIYREEAVVLVPKKFPLADSTSIESVKPSREAVTGIVRNEIGQPIAGATIYFKGSTQGTNADNLGRFSLAADKKVSSIIVSAVGYKGREVTITKNKTISVQLETAINNLEETIVIAYGTSTRRMLTGSVNKISAKEISQQPISNPLQALQGRVPGLQITPLTGLPGSDYKVELRGRNSISSGNNPLYIVDGIPFTATPLTWNQEATNDDAINPYEKRIGFGANVSSSALNVVNPADIESIEILKDADATAIFGSRGANGVILITTRKGAPGSMHADFNVYTGWGRVGHMIPYLSTPEYLSMRREAFRNDGATVHPQDYDLSIWDTTRFTDWQKALIGGSAHIQDVQGAVTGGTENAQFRISGNYHRESTTYPGSSRYQRGTIRSHITLNSKDQKWKATLISSYATEQNVLPSEDLSRYSILPPNMPAMKDNSNTLLWETGVFDNPYALLARTYKARTDHISLALLSSYQVLPDLELKASLGYTLSRINEVQVNPKSSYNPNFGEVKGFSNFADNSIKTWIIEPQLNYKPSIGKAQFNILAGVTFQQDLRDQEAYNGSGYTDDSKIGELMSAPTIKSLPGGLHSRYRYNAVFGRFNVVWDGKYILNLTGRRDGSSRYGPSHQFANFGAAGIGWIFSSEPFFKNVLPFLSYGKIRGSFGITGNDQIPDYSFSPGPVMAPPYQGMGGSYMSRLVNPDYGWEKNEKLEGGLELGFLRNRILLRAVYYSNRGTNQLVKLSLSGVTGFMSVRENIPAVVSNKGLELELNTVNVRNNNFTWTSSLNLTLSRNKLSAFPGLENSTYNSYFTIGQPLNQFKGIHYEGVDPLSGIYQFTDTNGDRKITAKDFQYSKPLGPTTFGGWQHSFGYKNWQLDALIQLVKQNGYNYEYTPDISIGAGAPYNQPKSVLNYWQKPGDKTNIQRLTQSFSSDAASAFDYLLVSDRAITDASFIRLKNINLSYHLPKRWLQRCHVESGRLYMQGQNLFTLTSYPGRDPENAYLPTANGYPPLRVWTAGLQIVF